MSQPLMCNLWHTSGSLDLFGTYTISRIYSGFWPLVGKWWITPRKVSDENRSLRLRGRTRLLSLLVWLVDQSAAIKAFLDTFTNMKTYTFGVLSIFRSTYRSAPTWTVLKTDDSYNPVWRRRWHLPALMCRHCILRFRSKTHIYQVNTYFNWLLCIIGYFAYIY